MSERALARTLVAVECVRDWLGTLGVAAVIDALTAAEVGPGHLAGAAIAVAIARWLRRPQVSRTGHQP